MGKLRGEKDIEATIQRLDRLTLDEGRATAAQTLDVVYGLVQHRRVIMDGARSFRSSLASCRVFILYTQTQTELNRQALSRTL